MRASKLATHIPTLWEVARLAPPPERLRSASCFFPVRASGEARFDGDRGCLPALAPRNAKPCGGDIGLATAGRTSSPARRPVRRARLGRRRSASLDELLLPYSRFQRSALWWDGHSRGDKAASCIRSSFFV